MYLQSLLAEFGVQAPDHQFVLFTPIWADPLLEPMPANVEVVSLPGVPVSRPLRILYQQTALAAAIACQRLDVFFATATVTPLMILVPVVLAVQFIQFYKTPQAYGRFRTAYLRCMLPLSLKKAQRAIIFSENSRHDLVRWTGVPVEKVSVVPHGLSWDIWRLAEVLQDAPERRVGAKHCHGPAAAPLLLRKRSGDPPVVLTLHAVRRYQYGLYRDLRQLARSVERVTGVPVRNPPRSYTARQPRIAWELWTERYLCRKADHLALVAEYFGPLLAEYYAVPPEKCTVTYNGSDFHPGSVLDRGAARASLGWPSDAQVILFVGRLEWQKRIQLLVQAMPSLLSLVEQARLLIVGGGEQREDLQHLVRVLGLEARVQLVEWVEHGRLRDFYRAADCLCLPSIWEGLSKVLLEGMSVGLPVVATDNVSNREILRGGQVGFLVGDPTPDGWASALCDVLRNPDAARSRAASASRLVNERYRWNHVADRLDGAYRRLIPAL